MKLWLDDLRPMASGFDVHVRTAAEAIRLLSADGVTEISLDHDLGEEENGTGYEVAKWIEEAAFRWREGAEGGLSPVKWAIHSQNPVGVAKMIQALRNADRFWKLRTSLNTAEGQ